MYTMQSVVDKLWWHVLVNKSNYPLVGLGPKSSLLVGTYQIKHIQVLNFKWDILAIFHWKKNRFTIFCKNPTKTNNFTT